MVNSGITPPAAVAGDDDSGSHSPLALVPSVASSPVSLTFRMPLPPPLAACFINARNGGRVKSTRYRRWIQEAGWLVRATVRERKIEGRCTISVMAGIPDKRQRDGDNLWKPILDLLSANTKHGLGIIEDDHCFILRKHSWEWVDGDQLEGLIVEVRKV